MRRVYPSPYPYAPISQTPTTHTPLTPQQKISQVLHGTAIQAFWSGTSFLLSSTVFQPTFALLSHIFGRKPLILTALALFTVGAIIAGLSHNFTALLIGRVIQGVGAGGVIALTEVIVTDLVPLRERGKWFGFISGVWAFGSVTGPVVGGAFAEKVSWVCSSGEALGWGEWIG